MRSSKFILPFTVGVLLSSCGHAASTSPPPSAFSAYRGALAASPTAAEPTVLTAPKVGTRSLTVDRSAAALAVLERRVTKLSHPEALQLAFQAYWNYRHAHPGQVRNPYFYFVDYGLDSREPRGYVFDMDALELVEGPFTVAHGRGSARGAHGIPTRFTNIQNSATTSLGLYLAQETYAFSGTSSGSRYRSVGLRLRGVSGKFNSAARRRGIVVHGAPYVTPAAAGRSEGCPAMEPERAERLIPLIAFGGLVFHFSPAVASWLREDPWMSQPSERLASRVDRRSPG
jgi:hypothetical protein